eukprot:COSAG01_NODE_23243_length_822_cov_1.583679_1_plen_98_part_10
MATAYIARWEHLHGLQEVLVKQHVKTASQVSTLGQDRHRAYSAHLAVQMRIRTQQQTALNANQEHMLAVAKRGAASVYRVRSTAMAAPQHHALRVWWV